MCKKNNNTRHYGRVLLSIKKRKERDSNSRYPFGVHTLSRRASSATRASFHLGVQIYEKVINFSNLRNYFYNFLKTFHFGTLFAKH